MSRVRSLVGTTGVVLLLAVAVVLLAQSPAVGQSSGDLLAQSSVAGGSPGGSLAQSSVAGGSPGGVQQTDAPQACAGHQSIEANGVTVVSVQGARSGENGGKRQARLVAFGPEGEVLWVHDSGREQGVVWSYDVDPMGNGNLFVTSTRPGKTLLYELSPRTGEVVWSEVLPFTDTHDADPLNRTHVVLANMRNYDEGNETNDDRVVVYDRKDDEIEWTWRFAPRYDRSVGGNYTDDWTHFNDVDRVGDDFLLSPRNFDQVLLVDRETGNIELTLGSDDNFGVLYEQHNPDYLDSREGDPTFLVADSENDRIVEYEHDGDEWTRTWTLGSEETLSWPRDADRLRNGHTLIGDSRNHRVVEVTPRGEVLWEVYVPWLVYDVERIPIGGFRSDAAADLGGSRGPTMADIRGTGTYDLSGPGAEPPTDDQLTSCASALDDHQGGFGSVDLGGTPTPDASQTPTRTPLSPTTGATPVSESDRPTTVATPASESARPTTVATPVSESDRPTTVATPVPTQTDDGSGVVTPGFGLVVALAALLAAAALARRRRSSRD